jgi:hypothetical protein
MHEHGKRWVCLKFCLRVKEKDGRGITPLPS